MHGTGGSVRLSGRPRSCAVCSGAEVRLSIERMQLWKAARTSLFRATIAVRTLNEALHHSVVHDLTGA
jgi:hypothetical protein